MVILLTVHDWSDISFCLEKRVKVVIKVPQCFIPHLHCNEISTSTYKVALRSTHAGFAEIWPASAPSKVSTSDWYAFSALIRSYKAIALITFRDCWYSKPTEKWDNNRQESWIRSYQLSVQNLDHWKIASSPLQLELCPTFLVPSDWKQAPIHLGLTQILYDSRCQGKLTRQDGRMDRPVSPARVYSARKSTEKEVSRANITLRRRFPHV